MISVNTANRKRQLTPFVYETFTSHKVARELENRKKEGISAASVSVYNANNHEAANRVTGSTISDNDKTYI